MMITHPPKQSIYSIKITEKKPINNPYDPSKILQIWTLKSLRPALQP